jgi:GT2 family glycosyltransferase
MVKVLISLINFNGTEDTLSCLNSLNEVEVKDFELNVVVIDNASKEAFQTDKQYENFNLKIIRSDKNLGFSGGQNLGIRYGLENGMDYFVILNNDVTLDAGFLLELLKTFAKEDCGLVSPKIYFAKGHEYHKNKYEEEELGRVIWYAGGQMDWKNVLASHRGVDEVDKGQFNELGKTDFASGCCIMIKKEVFTKIGLFDEKYFLYYEDNDLSQRAKKANFEIYYQPKAVIWHVNAGSAGGSGSDLQDYYITRNRLLFGFKFASFKTKIALVKESLMLMLRGRPEQKQGVKDFYLKQFGKGSYK